AGVILPCFRSTSSWNSSSFKASSSIDDFATGVLAADVAGVTGGRTAAPLTLDGAPDFAAEVAATDAPVCRFVTTHPPMASSTANPKRMGQRYFCRASGASIG